ncbi:MAG TPA: rod shape-determining protein RodA [Flavilitoribacter sp.]|nr:rod shape-determining protein RodA [Flavilitoribacter sp.]
MSTDNMSVYRRIDWITFSVCLGLMVVGLLIGIRMGVDDPDINLGGMTGFFSTPAGKQTIWVIIAALLFSFIMLIDSRVWQALAYPIYWFSITLLIAVLLFGATIKGAKSWFTFAGFSFQPSEIAKFGTCLAVAGYLSHYSVNLRIVRHQLALLGFLALPMGLILLQPDAGSALVFTSFLVAFYREGLSRNLYLVGFFSLGMLLLGFVNDIPFVAFLLELSAIGLMGYHLNGKGRGLWTGIFMIAGLIAAYNFLDWMRPVNILIAGGLCLLGLMAWAREQKKMRLNYLYAIGIVYGLTVAFAANYFFNHMLKPHQQDRVMVWLKPSDAPKDAKYNLEQSKLAISAGGFWGKGIFNGNFTDLNYVPEQATDFIFCTIGEEQGFMGSLSLIGLYLLLLYQLTRIAERQRTHFARIYAYGVAGIFFIHFLINIGMTMGLMPVIGIPLPFISKGGSSLLGFTLLVAVLIKMDSARYRPS